ncbi:MAG: NAD(P)-binding domain-containing protein [Pseudolabrys sp.]|nr:NAD(P)-binding domain-containing protein [Pseudolabrys sp.]
MSVGSASDISRRLPAGVQEADVLVIGAGQAGLAAGFHLRKTNLSFFIVDRSRRIGESWRKRYDSLTLFTPRAFSVRTLKTERMSQHGLSSLLQVRSSSP